MHKLFFLGLMLLHSLLFGQSKDFILDNGLKIIIKEDHRAPVAAFMIWYKVGSANEPVGLTGISHALEHMMFKGTVLNPKGVFLAKIAAIGGEFNAFTNYDHTAYYETVNAKDLNVCFELEADRMQNLLLDPNEFAKEIAVVQEERRLRTEDNPQALTFERLLAAAHLTEPYHHPIVGWMNDLQQMQINNLVKWYQDYYSPNNAIIVVVGDVNPHEVYNLSQKYFGKIKARPTPKHIQQIEPLGLGRKSIEVKTFAKVPMYMVSYTVPSSNAAANPWEPYAIEIISNILDGNDNSRLEKNLIRKSKTAANAGVYYDMFSRYQTQFLIYASKTQNHSINTLKKKLLQEIYKLKTQLISEAELAQTKKYIIAEKTFSKDSIYEQAYELGLLESLELGWKTAENFTANINAVTPEQIQQIARKYFNENSSTEAYLLPLRKA